MNKIFLLVASLALIAIWYFYPKTLDEKRLHVGIVLPIQHAALDDIVRGFQSELITKLGADRVKISVQNALGDINLQKSAINKFLNEHVDLLVPVATGTTQMAINLSPEKQAILFLAANITPDSPSAQKMPELMGVIDEIPIETQIKYIRKALPNTKKISIVYSANDKIPGDAASFKKASEQEGIAVQELMIQNLSELYTVAGRIDRDAEAIFILKDNLVASGIQALVQQALKLKIPLITSDEGTNSQGGAFAIGVVEADIGRQGGQMAAAHFDNTLQKPYIRHLEKIAVFINSESVVQQNLDLEALIKAAAALNLEVIKR